MPLPDNEPQYWLRDSSGTLVGAFYLDADGNPAIVDENGNEASLESDGTWDVPKVSTGELHTGGRAGRAFVYQLTGGDYVAVDADGTLAGPSSDPDAVLQAAADNVDGGVGIVHVEGDYAVQNTVTLTNKASLFGDTPGRGSFGPGTRLYNDGATGAVLQVGSSSTQTYGNEVKELMVGGGPVEWYSAYGSMDTVWVQNSNGNGLHLLEVTDGNHGNKFREFMIQGASGDGLITEAADHQFSNGIIRNSGNRGVVLIDGGNHLSNVHVWESSGPSFRIPSTKNILTNVRSWDNQDVALSLGASATRNVIFGQFGFAAQSVSGPIVTLSGDENYIGGVFIGTGNESQAFNIFGNDNIIEGQIVGNFTSAPVSNNGDRNIINGRSITTGSSPGSGSVWDGYETRAYNHDVTVEDRSVSAPYPQYKADSAGNWIQIG